MKDNTMGYEDPKAAQMKKSQPSKEDQFSLSQAVFNHNQYPQLKDIQEGQEVEGSFKGKISKSDEESCTVDFTDVNFETENSADLAVKRMMGRDNKPGSKVLEHDSEEEDM